MTSPPPLPQSDELAAYCEWEAILQEIVAAGGTTLVIGGTDVGKTTFTRLLVNKAVATGKRVAVIDADPGQSEIGPPSCAGLAFADTPIAGLSDLTPSALAFIGSTSSAARVPEHITAVRRLADLAGDRMLIVDTSGYIHGPGGRRLIQCESELLRPSHIVGLQRGDELSGIHRPLKQRTGCRIHTPQIPASIIRKPPSLRAQRREMQFSAYFRDAQPAQFALSEVAFTGTWLGGGTPVAAHLHRFLSETLGPPFRIYHAEVSGGHLGLMVNRPIEPNRPELGIIMGQLKVREVSITAVPRLKHLLVGMEAANGKLLGLGILVRLDFRRGTLGLVTPVRAPDAARILHFGIHRVAPDGTDGGSLKPGEL